MVKNSKLLEWILYFPLWPEGLQTEQQVIQYLPLQISREQ